MREMDNHDPIIDSLREIAWRRPLNAEEAGRLRQWLRDHPEQAADWDAELALSAGLERLPEAPVSSNFTSRVMAEIGRASDKPAIARAPWWSRLVPRLAFAAVLLAGGLVAYRQVDQSRTREYSESFEVISGIGSVPSPQILQDFDAIRALNTSAVADEELLALLQ